MSQIRYHISKHGVPRVCEAEPGRCRLSRDGIHYDSYEAAHVAAQEIMKDEYKTLPDSERSVLSKEKSNDLMAAVKSLSFKRLNQLEPSKFHERYKINTTTDKKLIMEPLMEGSYNSKRGKDVEAALRNVNIPREYVDSVISNPNLYSKHIQRNLMTNKSLSHNDLVSFIRNSEDIYAQSLAIRNPNLSDEFARDIIKTMDDSISELPWAMLIENENISPDSIRDFSLKVVNGEIDIDHNTINDINYRYPREFIDNEED